MVKFSDLVRGLSTIFKNNFPTYNIYAEPITQNIKRPAFHINAIPIASNNFNEYYREQNCLVDITYFSDEQADLQSHLKNLDMSNTIQTVLNTDIKVLDRNINLQNLEYNWDDARLLHTTFELMWYNENEVTEAYLNSHQVMEHFEIEIDGNVCYEYFITLDGEVFKTKKGDTFYVKCSDDEINLLREQNKIVI